MQHFSKYVTTNVLNFRIWPSSLENTVSSDSLILREFFQRRERGEVNAFSIDPYYSMYSIPMCSVVTTYILHSYLKVAVILINFSEMWNHQNKMTDLCSNRPFCSNNLIISSECKKSRWWTKLCQTTKHVKGIHFASENVCFWAGQIRPKETLSEAWGSAFRCCLVLNYEFLFTHIISVP